MSATVEANAVRTEQLTEWVFDALSGFFDFGEDGKESEDEHRSDIAKHVAKNFNKYVLFLGTDDVDALKQFRSSGQPGDGVCGESLIWFPEHEVQSLDEIIDRIEKEMGL